MKFQTVFKRYELKYLVTREQQQAILSAMEPYMQLDAYGETIIRNIYFDTDNYRLIRRSIERPMYKEKLRIRSYSQAEQFSTVFVELKKKFNSIVYKRRLPLPHQHAMNWIKGSADCPVDTQISREIDYFRNFYGKLKPSVFLSYRRFAYFDKSGTDFRVTFDDQILCRQEDLNLSSPVYGEPILDPELVLMEIKCSGGIPLWMTKVLSSMKIYKASFSKYGTAYENLIFNKTYLTAIKETTNYGITL
ncbi:MAG: polyphosphate polymerase domain-containing protein [Clostridia bacterium]|nr:polyphosphate polymerase domain-containing protein [Clostridia bacterium]